MKTRRRFTAEFKAKVALEAIRGGTGDEAPASPEPDHAVETAGH
jgi:transposase-like protein